MRPGIIYGDGDDMLRNIARGILLAPIWPQIWTGRQEHRPVNVCDVCMAITKVILQDQPSQDKFCESYTLVGPKQMTTADLISMTASSLGVPIFQIPVPVFVHKLLAKSMESVFTDPLITSAQMQMLSEGMSGNDSEKGFKELGIEPTDLTVDVIRQCLPSPKPFLNTSLRVVTDKDHMEWINNHRNLTIRAWLIIMLTLLLSLSLHEAISSIWWANVALQMVLIPIHLVVFPFQWRSLLKPELKHFGIGACCSIALWAVAHIGNYLVLSKSDKLGTEIEGIYSLKQEVSPLVGLALICFVGLGEEIQRSAITLSFGASYGHYIGMILSAFLFAVEVSIIVKYNVAILAAFIFGLAWSALFLRTKSVFASFTCHVVWDLLLLYVFALT